MIYRCTTCGGHTAQAPVVVEDRLYRSCCYSCVKAEKWQGVSVASASGEEVSKATVATKHSHDMSVKAALIQWAGEVLMEHRGSRKVPDGCRAWGS